MSRLRIERHRLPAPSSPGGRIRRDPRAERTGVARQPGPAPESMSASGRIRRDPRAARGSQRPAAQPERPATAALPRLTIEEPAYLILVVPDLEDGRLSSHDRDLLGAARLLAEAGKGAVACVPGMTTIGQPKTG